MAKNDSQSRLRSLRLLQKIGPAVTVVMAVIVYKFFPNDMFFTAWVLLVGVLQFIIVRVLISRTEDG